MTWKKRKTWSRIFPEGYYSVINVDNEGTTVQLLDGLYRGITVKIDPKFKIRKNELTGDPFLWYNYEIEDFGSYSPNELNQSQKLLKIVGAIAVELFSDVLLDNKDYKIDSLPTNE